MVIKFLTFLPDGHYGYPEPILTDNFTIPDRDELLARYAEADCSAYIMGEDDNRGTEGPFDDFQNYELYKHGFMIIGENLNYLNRYLYEAINNYLGVALGGGQGDYEANGKDFYDQFDAYMPFKGFIVPITFADEAKGDTLDSEHASLENIDPNSIKIAVDVLVERYKDHPLEVYQLDGVPELKKIVLDRLSELGVKDFGALGKILGKGLL